MGEMLMPGDSTMSMMWMRMPGQTWLGAAASFTAMWTLMMAPMMLPSLVPMLRRYGEAVGGVRAPHAARLASIVGAGYFAVWTVFGVGAYAVGAAMAAVAMQDEALSRAFPVAASIVMVLAGAVQFTRFKARQLARCAASPGHGSCVSPHAVSAWRHGLRIGFDCVKCCGNLMALLLVVGAMDLASMAVVTVAITAERLAPNGERVARATGVVVVAAGLLMLARAVIAGA